MVIWKKQKTAVFCAFYSVCDAQMNEPNDIANLEKDTEHRKNLHYCHFDPV